MQKLFFKSLISLMFPAIAWAGTTAVFNEPGFKGEASTSIEEALINLIDSTLAGASIRVAMYTFNSAPVAEHLVAAAQRGVDVQVVLDGENKKKTKEEGNGVAILAKGLGDKLKICKKSCRGTNIMHNKFFLFSKISDGRENVVAQTSSNMTGSQLRWYNDLLLVDGDARLFANLSKYWRLLRKQDMTLFKSVVYKGENGLKVYTFPRLKEDPVVKALKQVSCEIPGSVIRVAHSRFDDGRVAVAGRLKSLSQQGCDVKVIVRDEPSYDSPGKDVRAILQGLLTILPFEPRNNKETEMQNSIHMKVLVIKASIDNSKELKTLVLTGSHNLNQTSLLANDELMFYIPNDQNLFEAYYQFLSRLQESVLGVIDGRRI